MVEHRNTTATVRMVIKACEATGVDIDKLLAVSAIDPKTAHDPDGEVSATQMRSFWQNAYRLSNAPFLGMHAAEHIEIGTYKCLDYLTLYARTIGDSLEMYSRYVALINTWLKFELVKNDNHVQLRNLGLRYRCLLFCKSPTRLNH
ncbi:MAG: hypothetical protein ACI8P9_000846 [Parasphingorhabdus sp.]|jgi:hypothetical protein